MSNGRKYRITLILLCIFVSAFTSIIFNSIISTSSQNMNQLVSQSVIINELENSKTNINTCTKVELMSLPGIGETLADRIIANRPYYDIWELADIKGIGNQTLNYIIERIEV